MPIAASLSLGDAVALLHALLMVLFIYPVAAVSVRLAIHVRERRLGLYPLPASVLVEHAQHGQWLTSAVVVAVLLAWLRTLALQGPAPLLPAHAIALLLVGLASLTATLALWWSQRLAFRLTFALLSWIGLATLGVQAHLGQAATAAGPALSFWGSHPWGGLLLCGLLLGSTAVRQEIGRRPALRRLHTVAAALIAVLMVTQAISGCRNLLLLRSHDTAIQAPAPAAAARPLG